MVLGDRAVRPATLTLFRLHSTRAARVLAGARRNEQRSSGYLLRVQASQPVAFKLLDRMNDGSAVFATPTMYSARSKLRVLLVHVPSSAFEWRDVIDDGREIKVGSLGTTLYR